MGEYNQICGGMLTALLSLRQGLLRIKKLWKIIENKIKSDYTRNLKHHDRNL